MAAVPAVANSRSALAQASPAQLNLVPTEASTPSAKLQKSLDDLFPDLMVQGTRNCLLNVTTSLTKASSSAHNYFARVSYMLAFERMMRGFMQATAAIMPFPMHAMAATGWNGMFMPAGQAAASAWGLPAPAAPQPNPALAFLMNALQPQAATPNTMQAWCAPAGGHQPNPLSMLAGMFQPQAAAPSQPWPDYNALLMVPMAYLAAAPGPESWWSFGA